VFRGVARVQRLVSEVGNKAAGPFPSLFYLSYFLSPFPFCSFPPLSLISFPFQSFAFLPLFVPIFSPKSSPAVCRAQQAPTVVQSGATAAKQFLVIGILSSGNILVAMILTLMLLSSRSRLAAQRFASVIVGVTDHQTCCPTTHQL